MITALEGSVGKDRFYVMALEDFNDENGSRYAWYDAAYDEGMSDYATATSEDFGAGKTNTATMIAKWNASEYGPQDDDGTYKDMWGVIQDEAAEGWFVPSIGEWLAFGDNFNITSDNYTDYNLSNWRWSSVQDGTNRAWYINFANGKVSNFPVTIRNCVRLSTMF